MTVTAGTPGTFPQVRILSLSGEPLYVVHGASFQAESYSSQPGRIVAKFDDLFDDEHDRCIAFDATVAGFTVEYTHDAGMRARAFLVFVKHYTNEVTPEKWLTESQGKRFQMADCNPMFCVYGYEHPHRVGAPFVPPAQTVIAPMYREPGPQPVEIEFVWQADDVLTQSAGSDR